MRMSEYGTARKEEKWKHTSTCTHDAKSGKHSFDARALHIIREHEFVRHELDQSSVDQDTSTNAVEDTVGDERGLAVWRVGLADTEADGDGDWGADCVAAGQEVRGPFLALRPWNCGESRAETETFECLVEDEDDVEGDELAAGYGQG